MKSLRLCQNSDIVTLGSQLCSNAERGLPTKQLARVTKQKRQETLLA